MVIRHSNHLLEQLSDVEEKIKLIERMIEQLGLEIDSSALIEQLFAVAMGPTLK